jgi:hypothetical protein
LKIVKEKNILSREAQIIKNAINLHTKKETEEANKKRKR